MLTDNRQSNEILTDNRHADRPFRPSPIVYFFQSVVLSPFPGGPVVVTVGFYLLSINSINVVDMVSMYLMIIIFLLCFSQ